MALKQNKLNNIPQRNKDLVFGYVKECEKQNKPSIPSMIKYLCLVYLNVDKDKFDAKNTHEMIEREDDGISRQEGYYGACSSFLENIMDKGVHIWTFQCDYLCDTEDVIGIRKINADSNTPFRLDGHFYIDGEDDEEKVVGYGFILLGSLTNPTDVNEYGADYGEPCYDNWNGGILEMKLDFNNLTLSYKMGGVDYGKAFDIEQTKYKAAVTLDTSKALLSLLSYQHIY